MKCLKKLMTMIITAMAINPYVDYNLEVVGSLVCAAIKTRSLLSNTSPSGAAKKIRLFVHMNGVWKKEEVDQSTEYCLKDMNEFMSDIPNAQKMSLFCANLQLCNKTKDSILWQKSDVCQKLSLPSSFQCFARGGSIKGKYRKSKSKGLGPLTLVNSLRELQGASKLNHEVKKKISKDLVSSLMKMCVGTSQKAIIRKFQQGDYSEIATFAKSLVVIKHCVILYFTIVDN